MSTQILRSAVQAEIDAISYPIDVETLLQHSINTNGLGLDLTNIIAVHTLATAAVDNNTPIDDKTALTASSIALGITSKAGDFTVNKGAEKLTLSEYANLPVSSITVNGGLSEVLNINMPGYLTNLIVRQGHQLELYIDGILWLEKIATYPSSSGRTVVGEGGFVPYIKITKNITIKAGAGSGQSNLDLPFNLIRLG